MLTIKNALLGRVVPLLPLLLFIAGCAPPGPRALIKGRKLLDRQCYVEAVEQLTEATSLMNSNAHAWNDLGLALQYAGQTTNAVRAYQKALALDPNLVEAHYNLGCLWLEQNHPDNARSQLTAYTALRKNAPEGWLKLAEAHRLSARRGPAAARQSDLLAADSSYREVLQLDGQNAGALNGLGLIQMDFNRPGDAAKCFRQALLQDSNYAPALLNLAVVSQSHLKDQATALENYRRYLALSGPSPHANAVQEAIRDLEIRLQPAPRQPAARSNVTAPAQREKARPGAEQVTAPIQPGAKPAIIAPSGPAQAVAAAPKISPELAPPAPTPVKMERSPQVASVPREPAVKPAVDSAPLPSGASASQAKLADAPASTRAAAASPNAPLNPSQKRSFLSRVNPMNALHRDANAPSGGVSSSTKAGDSNRMGSSSTELARAAGALGSPHYRYTTPPHPVAGDTAAAQRAFKQGYEFQKSDRLAEAVQSYRQAAQLDPAFFDAHYNLGLTAALLRNFEQSLAAYEQALAIRPQSPDARYNFALVLKQANYVGDAIRELEKLQELYPDEPRAHLALGNICAQVLRNPVLARQHYVKVLQIDPHNAQASAIRRWMVDNPP